MILSAYKIAFPFKLRAALPTVCVNDLAERKNPSLSASNIATKHILDASLYLTLRTCENISLRAADMMEFALTNNALTSSIGKFNVGTLRETKDLHLYDFGLFLDLDSESRLNRRIKRDIKERGRTENEVIKRFNQMCEPMYQKFIYPSRTNANVIINSDQQSINDIINLIDEFI